MKTKHRFVAKKVSFLVHDWRAKDGKARAVRVLREALAHIQRGTLNPECLILLSKSPADKDGLCDYEMYDNYLSKAESLYLLVRAQHRVMGED